MHRKIIHKKLAAATIIETVVALLIVMISFSAGLVIYNRIISTGVNDQQLHAGLQTVVVADSLLQVTDIQDQQLISGGQHFTIRYSAAQFPGLMLMKVICTDGNGQQLAEQIRLIKQDETQ